MMIMLVPKRKKHILQTLITLHQGEEAKRKRKRRIESIITLKVNL